MLRLKLSVSLIVFLLFTTSSAGSDVISDLLDLRSDSPSGVIRLSDHLLGQILALPRPRPFSLLIFFDAQHLHDKSELQLSTLKSEFSILSQSFLHNNAADPDSDKLFFFDIEFKDSQRSFSLFGVNSLPHVRLVTPTVKDLKDSDRMDQGDMSRLADSMSEFVESRTKISIGPLKRPPMVSTKQIAFVVVLLLISAPFVVKKVINGETFLTDYKVWLASSIFVYFFSVGGTMHNIIRKMPMFIADKNDPAKMVFFYQGSGMQLGAEGFAMGFLFTIVGILLGFLTHGLVKVESVRVQRFTMAVALIVSFWAVSKVVYLDNWKTGYGVHAYWPSSWIWCS